MLMLGKWRTKFIINNLMDNVWRIHINHIDSRSVIDTSYYARNRIRHKMVDVCEGPERLVEYLD